MPPATMVFVLVKQILAVQMIESVCGIKMVAIKHPSLFMSTCTSILLVRFIASEPYDWSTRGRIADRELVMVHVAV